MTAPAHPPVEQPNLARTKPSASAAFMALVKLFVGEVATRGRIILIGGLSLLASLSTLIALAADDSTQTAAEMIAILVIGLVIPISTLLFATSTIGELRADKTLLYLTLKPIGKGVIVSAAMAATLLVALPLAVATVVVAALLVGEVSLVAPAALGAAITVVGYTGVFVPLGAITKRSFLFGLGYVLLWGGLIAKLGSGFAALSIESYGVSIIEQLADLNLPAGDRSLGASYVVPAIFLLAGWLIGTWRLKKGEVD